MADEQQKIPKEKAAQEKSKGGSSKVSYSKTRSAVSNKYSPRHFSDAEAEKSYRQLRLERTRIKIRKIKRLNIVMTLLTIAILFTLFIGSSVIIPRTVATVDKTQYADKALTIDFVGDMMLGRYIQQQSENDGYSEVFRCVSPYFKNADLTFASLESAVLFDDESTYTRSKKENNYYCVPAALQAARDAGINVFALSNDHAYDYGAKALEQLAVYFKNAGSKVYASGIGMNTEDAAQCQFIDCKGYKIAFVSITDIYQAKAISGKERSGVLSTAYGRYNRMVHDASKQADITIVYFHWGEEDTVARDNEQISLGHRLIDAGADIVIGTNPHVVQEIEKYKDGVICYSLGNFVSDQGTTFARDSVIIELTIDKNGNPEFTLIPVRLVNGMPEVTDGFFYKARINRELTQGLSGDDYYTGDDGYVHVRLGVTYQRAADAAPTTAPTTVPTIAPAPTEPTQPDESQSDNN